MNTNVNELEAAHTQLDRGSPRWRLKAACAGIKNPDIFFAQPRMAAHRQALALCQQCPVRRECLDDAIECGVRDGIRGGRTEDQLREIVSFREGRQVEIERVRATLTNTHRPHLTDQEKMSVVRVAIDAGIPIDTWAAALGIGYSYATRRRRKATTQLDVIPASMRGEEIALAAELRHAATTTLAVAA
ncbi:WhiB family transcriptional regulator [Kitasatospora aureofaciens]|uniref:WhiB family transcriptional regulator n=1 Tax=Kitasatospora aureofaciens TaxID=1894 RepID=UPI001C477C24|nr:WhiB family transcriptional regulator [Kitasatospora aureofaciens]MBV6695587.1 WhiB family transcriptional regulator [Kitasatospora aureofaciens]